MKSRKYRHNKTTDRAVVTLNGVDHWLGKHDSPESRETYDRLIHEWLGNPSDPSPVASFGAMIIPRARQSSSSSVQLVSLSRCDIDTGNDQVWTYKPQFHKTEHHDVERIVYLGARAQEIIRPHLKPNPTAYRFCPKDAEAWRHAQAKTHRRAKQKRNEKQTDRVVGDRYDDNSYRRAVARACAKADAAARKQRREMMEKQGIELDPAEDVRIVPRWHPNQLRHTAATRLRKQFGLETARVILGHQSAAMTEVYAEADRDKARQIMAQVLGLEAMTLLRAWQPPIAEWVVELGVDTAEPEEASVKRHDEDAQAVWNKLLGG